MGIDTTGQRASQTRSPLVPWNLGQGQLGRLWILGVEVTQDRQYEGVGLVAGVLGPSLAFYPFSSALTLDGLRQSGRALPMIRAFKEFMA